MIAPPLDLEGWVEELAMVIVQEELPNKRHAL